MLKLILSLILNRTSTNEWRLQIGAHLLRKGCGYQVGQIIKEKKIGYKRYRVKVITNLLYDFNKNEIKHLGENKIMDLD
jgi:hypothetical protein